MSNKVTGGVTEADWLAACQIEADFGLIDEGKIGAGHFRYHEEDAFDSDACLRDDVRKWLSRNMQANWTTMGYYGAEVLVFLFESQDDAVLFKMRWQGAA